MVQFSLKMEYNRVEKWSTFYVKYNPLKKKITQLKLARRADARGSRFLWLPRTVSPGRSARQAGVAPHGLSSSGAVVMPPATENMSLLPHSSRGTKVWRRRCIVGQSTDEPRSLSFEDELRKQIEVVEAFFDGKLRDLRSEIENTVSTASKVPEEAPQHSSRQHAKVMPTAEGRRFLSEAAEASSAGQSTTGETEAGVFGGYPGQQSCEEGGSEPSREDLAVDKEKESLRRALLSLYRDLKLLENFGILNYTAVIKITKKYDKKVVGLQEVDGVMLEPLEPLTEKMLELAHQKNFYDLHQLRGVIRNCEGHFARMFCGGNVVEARGMMLPHRTDETINLAQFQFGYRVGIATLLGFWVIWDCCFEPTEKLSKCFMEHNGYRQMYLNVLLAPAFPIFRALGDLLLLRWCWALSCLVWQRARINYIYLFELDPRAVSTLLEVFNNVAGETIFYLATLLVYYKMLLGRLPHVVPSGCLPLALCVYLLLQMFLPGRKSREFWNVILRVLKAPAIKVDFFATYAADVMTSSVKTTQDMAWGVCFFLSGDFLLDLNRYHETGISWQESAVYKKYVVPGLCFLPLWLRFSQCLRRYFDTQKRSPHIENGAKYALAFTVALFGVLRPPNAMTDVVKVIWLALYVVSTLYTFAWDVFQDWGLGDASYAFLRKKRLYPRASVYYVAVALDLILRFNWLYSVIPPGKYPLAFLHTSSVPVFVNTVISVCELLRRTMWGFFRLEKEHLSNAEGYRTTKHVPLHFKSETWSQDSSKSRVVISEVIAVSLAGVAMAALAIVAARNQNSHAAWNEDNGQIP